LAFCVAGELLDVRWSSRVDRSPDRVAGNHMLPAAAISGPSALPALYGLAILDGKNRSRGVRAVTATAHRHAIDRYLDLGDRANGCDPPSEHSPDEGGDRFRTIGAWSAQAMFLLDVVYIIVFIVGFASLGNTSKPLPDPYLAIAEVLILVMAPIMVLLMLAIHQCAPKQAKPFTQVALGWMLAAATFTTVVHFVELTVARHINPATFPGYERIFDFKWPPTVYAIDIVAWDVFFGLSLLFAAPAFARSRDATLVGRGLIASGSLCVIGLMGPFANALGWRTIGILGYTVVFGLTCLPLTRASKVATSSRDPSPT
jgi:hypothetical protein